MAQPHPFLPDSLAAARWQRAAPATSPWLHEEVARRMQERLQWMRQPPAVWCHWAPVRGGLQAHGLIAQRYPQADCVVAETPAHEAQARAALNKKLKGVRNQLKKIEAELDKKRARYDELMELMASEELYADQDKFNAALGEYNGLKQELPKLEDEWLELSTQIEEETARELS